MSVIATTIIGIWMRHPSAGLPRHIFHPYSNRVIAGIVLHGFGAPNYAAPLPHRPLQILVADAAPGDPR